MKWQRLIISIAAVCDRILRASLQRHLVFNLVLDTTLVALLPSGMGGLDELRAWCS
ncbi:hypothetical protein GALMADRAFT_257381 [Galerina marginata CBS 339.88]|uniref:Uncharacterized protein n=1 Tax=Galerina marginata (strain CBS 339.88) TaxID=685588 RepID=A0A067SKB0_GALM3|nr:hypothetical protein GALMADRAFT_257381 [Galerina marginata CBS 339.88]